MSGTHLVVLLGCVVGRNFVIPAVAVYYFTFASLPSDHGRGIGTVPNLPGQYFDGGVRLL